MSSAVLVPASGLQCENVAATATLEVGEWITNGIKEEGEPALELVDFGPYLNSTESGHFAPGSYNGGGATGPTKIGLSFSEIPAGVALSIPKTIEDVEDRSFTATLEGSACGASGAQPVAIDISGKGTAVYRVCTSNANFREEARIPIAVSWTGGAAVGTGVGKVHIGLLPFSGVPAFTTNGDTYGFLVVNQCDTTQTPRLVCQPTAEPALTRAEEKTARLGDIYLNCVSSDPGLPPPAELVAADIEVQFRSGVAASNNIDFGAGSNIIDAVLVVNGNNCLTPASQGGSYGCGGAYQDPQFGEKYADIAWRNVKLPFPGAMNSRAGIPNPATTTIRLTSMRGNTGTPGVPANGALIEADVQLYSDDVDQIGNRVPVAMNGRGLVSRIQRQIAGQSCAAGPLGAASTALVTLGEGFASAFRVQGTPSFLPDYGVESGYYAPGSNNGGGASGPTQIRLAFSDIPEGVTISAPSTVAGTGGLTLTVAGQGCNASGQQSIPVDSQRRGELIYRACATAGNIVQELNVPISASWSAGNVSHGSAKVTVSLFPQGDTTYPLSDERTSGPYPEPRFYANEPSQSFLGIGPCGLSSDIVLSAVDGGQSAIFVIPKDGGVVPVSDNGRMPLWSPNGTKLLYEVGGVLPGLVVINADGTGPVPVGFPVDTQAQWSPDGSKFAFVSNATGNYEVYSQNANGTGRKNLTNHPAPDSGPGFAALREWSPQWSPDGSKIAFTTNRDGNWEIYVMNSDGGSPTNLTRSSSVDWFPRWSPDGSKIAFLSTRDGNDEIYVMSSDGSAPKNLTNHAAKDGKPEWSPDGSKLAFETDRDGNYEVYWMDSDGGSPANFTQRPGSTESLPRWSPDGSQISFWSTGATPAGAFVKPLLGGESTFVFPSSHAAEWRGTRIAPPPPPPPPPPPGEEEELYLTKLGVYSDGKWLQDHNGDGLLDEEVETTFGFKGTMPLTGDWDGDGKQEIAVYANNFGTGFWFLDLNGNGVWDDGVDEVSLLGWGNDFAKPVIGDWNGDGRSKIGVYSNGLWLLDYDGNGALNANDKIFQFGGWEGSVPLVGDWNGDGRDSAGIYVPGHFVLDYNADHHFENGPEDRVYEFGISGSNVVPVIGDWNGNGKKNIGIFRSGQWSLDLNGDGQANGSGESLFFFGTKAGSPVVGDWAGIGKDSIGAVDDGAWYLDVNGDFVHNGLDPILFWGDEGANRFFIPGKWQSPNE